MSSIASLQLTSPVAGSTTFTSLVTDLLRHNSLAYSAFYSHASLAICNLKLYFSTDGVDFDLYKTITLDNNIRSTGNELIPARYFKFEVQNPDVSSMSEADIFFTAFVNASSNIDVNLTSADAITIPGVAQESTQLLVKNAVVATNGKITACNTGAVVVSSSALPTGAATATKQDDIETKLTEIDSILDNIKLDTANITACDTGAVVVSSSALPTGAATQAKQVDIETKLTDIDSVLDNIDTGINKPRTTVLAVYTNSTVTAGDVTGSISMDDGKDRYTQIQLVGDSETNAYKFIIEYSTDNVAWYCDGVESSHYNNGSRYEFSVSRINITVPFIRVKSIANGATVNMSYSLTK